MSAACRHGREQLGLGECFMRVDNTCPLDDGTSARLVEDEAAEFAAISCDDCGAPIEGECTRCDAMVCFECFRKNHELRPGHG